MKTIVSPLRARDKQRWRFLGGQNVEGRSAEAADQALQRMRLGRFRNWKAAMLSHGGPALRWKSLWRLPRSHVC